MYHIKKIKIRNLSFIAALISLIFYLGGSTVFVLTGFTIDCLPRLINGRQLAYCFIYDLAKLEFLLGWLGILIPISLVGLGMGALIALIYNHLAADGKGIKMEIELTEDNSRPK